MRLHLLGCFPRWCKYHVSAVLGRPPTPLQSESQAYAVMSEDRGGGWSELGKKKKEIQCKLDKKPLTKSPKLSKTKMAKRRIDMGLISETPVTTYRHPSGAPVKKRMQYLCRVQTLRRRLFMKNGVWKMEMFGVLCSTIWRTNCTSTIWRMAKPMDPAVLKRRWPRQIGLC